jgi:hypothetical protein
VVEDVRAYHCIRHLAIARAVGKVLDMED